MKTLRVKRLVQALDHDIAHARGPQRTQLIELQLPGADPPAPRCGERIQAYYEERARGGAGLLIMETSTIAWPAGATASAPSRPRPSPIDRSTYGS